MEELLDQIPLAAPIKFALLNREGELGELLDTVIRLERGEWQVIAEQRDITVDYNNAYLSAINWAETTADQMYAA